MCLILLKPSKKTFPRKEIETNMARNSDGYGFMFVEDGRVHIKKMLKPTYEDVKQAFRQLEKQDSLHHWRLRTHGDISPDNVHPYQILNKDKHGIDLYLMHNGVISCVDRDVKKSDTALFCENWLKPVLVSSPDLIKNEAFQKFVAKAIGDNSKLALMNSLGDIIIVNEHKGSWRHGCWVSNTYSILGSTSTPSYPAHNRPIQQTPGFTPLPGRSTPMQQQATKDEEDNVEITKSTLRYISYFELEQWVVDNPQDASTILFDLLHGGS